MKNVSRPGQPASLAKNADKWTKSLMAALAAKAANGTGVPKSVWGNYNKKDVRRTLENMYFGVCCYCESRVSHVAKEHIEHRIPKSKKPQLTFSWTNLHLACPKCNESKADKWDEKVPILDAADSSEPTEKHLGYKLFPNGDVIRTASTERGATTINHTDLNRTALREARSKVALAVMGLAKELCDVVERDPSDPSIIQVQAELEMLRAESEFSSVIAWAAG